MTKRTSQMTVGPTALVAAAGRRNAKARSRLGRPGKGRSSRGGAGLPELLQRIESTSHAVAELLP